MNIAYTNCVYCGYSFTYDPSKFSINAILVTCPNCHKMYAFAVNAKPVHPELVINDPDRAFTAPVDVPDPAETFMKQVESAEAATVETEEIAQSGSE